MPSLARNRRLMYAYAAIKNIGNSVTFVFGTILVFQTMGVWGMVAYNVAWIAGGVLAAVVLVPASRRLPIRTLSVAGLVLLTAGYGLMASGWAFSSLWAMVLVAAMQGLGMETNLWSQEVLFKSAAEDETAGAASAAFMNAAMVSSALAPALLGALAVGQGLAWAIGVAAVFYGLSAVPLAFYHEGHLAEHLPTSDSLLDEWRKVRNEYAFRSDAMRSAIDALHVESYMACLLVLLFLRNASSPAVVGYVAGGATLLALVVQWLKGHRYDAGIGRDVPVGSTLVAQAAVLVQPLLAGTPLAFGVADATSLVFWGPAAVVAAANNTRNMQAFGGAGYMALLHAASRLLVLPFYAVLAAFLLGGLPLGTALVLTGILAGLAGLPYALVLNRQSEHPPTGADDGCQAAVVE